jgi:hypothetical protein
MSSFVLLFTPFYAICPPFQEAPSGNPKLDYNNFGYKITVQQIENHGNKHWAHYAGLVGSNER